ncbi:4Fe-4S ferredoxin [Chitinivibrio alkaliphilus ACht1]|uniref:4Fe-4S ferredoxin n=1 Tax=Chitinivibrio alkaliphilus ACht1 TaxID=1313304 RepID=U7D8P8_9BACT|nr:4Fe-4S ferredoxin [Chitinivibrio alkaliphilus ACht1]
MFIIAFFVLSIYNPIFGILGIICMATPLYFSLRGYGKIHCSHYCPRGSFLGTFLNVFSFKKSLPPFFRKQYTRHVIFGAMMGSFIFSLSQSGGDVRIISFILLRMMTASFIMAIFLGIFFKPRAWCQVCPMGHATGLIETMQKKENR